MAISIPALIGTQLTALKATLLPLQDGATNIASSPVPPYVLGNRAADMLTLLTGLIDATGLSVQGIHGAADAADVDASPAATDPASGYVLANALKAAYNLHIAKTAGDVHWAADVTNAVTAPDADTEAKLFALANDLKASFNAHVVFLTGNTHRFADTKAVVTTADASDFATSYVLLNALQPKYNAHVIDIGCATTALADTAAFTTANSLIGAKVTFTGDVTTALAGVSAYVISNTANVLNFTPGVLSAAPQTGDTYAVEFSSVDADIAAMSAGKGMGDSASNPYGPGPSFVNAVAKIIIGLGGTAPSYMDTQAKITALATAFYVGSPHAGAGSQGHGGAAVIADMLTTVSDTIAAYTKPA